MLKNIQPVIQNNLDKQKAISQPSGELTELIATK